MGGGATWGEKAARERIPDFGRYRNGRTVPSVPKRIPLGANAKSRKPARPPRRSKTICRKARTGLPGIDELHSSNSGAGEGRGRVRLDVLGSGLNISANRLKFRTRFHPRPIPPHGATPPRNPGRPAALTPTEAAAAFRVPEKFPAGLRNRGETGRSGPGRCTGWPRCCPGGRYPRSMAGPGIRTGCEVHR